MSVDMCRCQEALLQEIGDPKMTRKDVAKTYALALKSSECDEIDWQMVNEAIAIRWSWSALSWIKSRHGAAKLSTSPLRAALAEVNDEANHDPRNDAACGGHDCSCRQ